VRVYGVVQTLRLGTNADNTLPHLVGNLRP
jgi:hypothetical protein